jgi:putative glutamine amidotransferase
MKPRIVLPEPCSNNRPYCDQVLPDYVAAVEAVGGEVVIIESGNTVKHIVDNITSCSAVLLTSCGADVDPQKYGDPPHPKSAPPDLFRATLDELLLQDAYSTRKPIFGICYGLQSLAVWNGAKLVQDITAVPDYDALHGDNQIHTVHIWAGSKILAFLGKEILVKSKHRQAVFAADADPLGKYLPGQKLRVSGVNPNDKIVEAVEGTDPDHFVLGVQWHPERHFNNDSRKIFAAFVSDSSISGIPD